MTQDRMAAECSESVDRQSFRKQLSALINTYSQENGSNTPDYILAEYLVRCLDAFDDATMQRDRSGYSSGAIRLP